MIYFTFAPYYDRKHNVCRVNIFVGLSDKAKQCAGSMILTEVEYNELRNILNSGAGWQDNISQVICKPWPEDRNQKT